MQLAIEAGDRKLLSAAIAILVALAVSAALLGTGKPNSAGYPSSYSAASDGAKATYLTLAGLGYRTERWLDPPRDLPKEGTLLVLADPFLPATEDERRQLSAYVQAGGKVLATGALGARLVPQAAAAPKDILAEWQEFPALVPAALTRGAPKITLAPQSQWAGHTVGQVPLYGTSAEPVAVVYRLGQGEVLWLASSIPLTNAGVQRAGNLELLLNFAADPRQTRILWDEYFHGQGRSLGAYFARTPLPWGLLQIGVLAALALLAFARHSGPVHPRVQESRLSPLEFLDTVGGLYQRAHAARGAVEVAAHRFRFLLAKRLGMPLTAPDAQLAAAARQRLAGEDGLLDLLQRCRRAEEDLDLQDASALELVRALHHYTKTLHLQTAGEAAWRWNK